MAPAGRGRGGLHFLAAPQAVELLALGGRVEEAPQVVGVRGAGGERGEQQRDAANHGACPCRAA
jgi:hypothetical protein